MAPKQMSEAKRRKVADDEAKAMVNSFAKLGEVAFEKELGYIMEELRSDRGMTYQLSGLMKDGTLKSLLSGEMADEERPSVVSSRRRVNPAKHKKFKNLKDVEV